MAFNIMKEKTIIRLMNALSKMYKKPFATNKVYFMQYLSQLKMGEGVLVAEHINELDMIVNQLSSVEINFNDEVRALIYFPHCLIVGILLLVIPLG